jgi:hypothetical protein
MLPVVTVTTRAFCSQVKHDLLKPADSSVARYCHHYFSTRTSVK